MQIAVFGFDAAESSQIRRIRSLLYNGLDVVAFTMRRKNMNADFVPPWNNVHLFTIENEQPLKRILILILSVFKMIPHAAKLRRSNVIMARNFDMLLLAFAAKYMAFKPGLPVIYECLDIHGSFTGHGRTSAVLRAVERFFLRRIELLVVSSPGFLTHYFHPIQHYTGIVHLMENKLWFEGDLPARRSSPANLQSGRPWVIGWVGSIRCEPSFQILLKAAEVLGSRIRIEIHGNIHRHVVANFEERIAPHANIRYHGPYAYPEGLAPVYQSCDLVWAQDLWQKGANSDWLLPNRIYEASYFGCLSIAVAGTETGDTVAQRGLGYSIPEASALALCRLIASLDPREVEARRIALLAQDKRNFVYQPDEVLTMIHEATA